MLPSAFSSQKQASDSSCLVPEAEASYDMAIKWRCPADGSGLFMVIHAPYMEYLPTFTQQMAQM